MSESNSNDSDSTATNPTPCRSKPKPKHTPSRPKSTTTTSQDGGEGEAEADVDPKDNADDPTDGDTDYKPAQKRPRFTTGNSSAGGRRKWTSTEMELLLDAALRGSVPISVFEGAVPGRTRNQSELAWR